MLYGYARVSTDGQSVAAQVAVLRKHGAGKVFREVASGAKTDRAQLRRLLDQLDAGDVLMVTRLDRLARSTRDLLNTLAAITGKKAGFRSLGDTWADTTTAHGRLILTVLGGLAEFERESIRARTGEGRSRAEKRDPHMGRPPRSHVRAEGRGPPPTCAGRYACRTRAQLRRQHQHDFAAGGLNPNGCSAATRTQGRRQRVMPDIARTYNVSVSTISRL
jgi:DNA invertase Pin-like site-specific DNA recombinase